MDPGVYELPRERLLAVLSDLPEGTRLYTLPSRIASKSAFFDAACSVLPMNPPLQRVNDVWDALDDSLGGGFLDRDDPLAVIVWEDPETLAEADPESGRIAVEILSGLPSDLLNPAFNAGFTRRVVVLLGSATALG